MALAVDRRGFGRIGPASLAAGIILFTAAAALATVWVLQLGFGLAPCHLCFVQRWPYYAALPVAGATVWLARHGRASARIGLACLLVLMLASAGLGLFHAGVEWRWWTGPTDCTGAGTTIRNAKDLLKGLNEVQVVRCDEAALRVLGLSLAGWNVLASLALAAVAGWGLRRR